MVQMNSLNKDQNDEKVFQSIKGSKKSEMAVPMFFDSTGASINLEDQYKGASIFVICNGPSFAELDHSLLKQPGIITYGMNNGAKTFRPNFWTCVDSPSRFLRSIWQDPSITKIVPSGLLNKRLFDSSTWKLTDERAINSPNVIGFKRNEKFKAERFMTEETFNWGNHKSNGGCRSVMLPIFRICYLLGFRKVYLLGCDFNMSENNTYHFDEQRKKGAVNCNRKTYGRLESEYFPALKPLFEERGFKVYNCNPDSGLTCFEHVPYEKAIADAIAPLGDIANERTYGLYSGEEEKAEIVEEPSLEQKKNLQKEVVNGTPQPEPNPVIPPPPNPTVEYIDDGDTEEVGDDEIIENAVEQEEPVVLTFMDKFNGVTDINEIREFMDEEDEEEVNEVIPLNPEECENLMNGMITKGVSLNVPTDLRQTLKDAKQPIVFPPSQPPLLYGKE